MTSVANKDSTPTNLMTAYNALAEILAENDSNDEIRSMVCIAKAFVKRAYNEITGADL